MTTELEEAQRAARAASPARILHAHIFGVIVGNVVAAIAVPLVKKYVLPLLNLEESPMDKLAGLIKDLPVPDVKDADLPGRPLPADI